MFKYPSKPKNNDDLPAHPSEKSPSKVDWSTTSDMNSFGDVIPMERDDMEMDREIDREMPMGTIAPVSTMSARNVLNSDVSVVGILRFSNELLVDGNVEGEITSDGVLTVGANATIVSQKKDTPAIRTKSAIIHGKVSGNVVVDDLVELAKNSELIGDITASRLIVHEGAIFIGRSAVGAPSSQFSNMTKKNPAPASTVAKSATPTPVAASNPEAAKNSIEFGDLLA